MIRFAEWGVCFCSYLWLHILNAHEQHTTVKVLNAHRKTKHTRLAVEWKLKNMYPNILCDFSSTSHSLWLSWLMCTFSSRQKPIACVFVYIEIYFDIYLSCCVAALCHLKVRFLFYFLWAHEIFGGSDIGARNLFHSNRLTLTSRPIFILSKSIRLRSYQLSNIFRANSMKQLNPLFILHSPPPQRQQNTESILNGAPTKRQR